MKKSITLSLVASSILYATSVPVSTGWNLVGAISDIDPSTIGCAKSVWTYDPNDENEPWKLYQNIDSSQNYGYEKISKIHMGAGFWLDSTCATSVDFNTTTYPPYNMDNFMMYGYYWNISKSDERYNYSGNTVEHGYDQSNPNFIRLTTLRQDDKRSRTEFQTHLHHKVMGASTEISLDITSTGYNSSSFRAHSDITIPETLKSDLGLSSTNVRAYNFIVLKGKLVKAFIYLEDNSGNEVEVWSEAIFETDDSSNIIGKWLELSIGNEDNNSITFSAKDMATGNQFGSPVTYPRPDGVIDYGIYKLAVSGQIKDDSADSNSETAGEKVQLKVRDVKVMEHQDHQMIDMNTTSADTLGFTSFTKGFNFEVHEDDWFSEVIRNNTTFSVKDYEMEDNGSFVQDETFGGTFTQNSEQNASIFVTDEGFGADLIIKNTQKINSIGDNTYSDLYISDIEFHVTASGTGWTDTWDWAPRYWDSTLNKEVNVTSTVEFLDMLLTQNNWIGGDDYAMLTGTSTGTIGDSGNIVAGYVKSKHSCDIDGDGVQDEICEYVERTSTVIGTWELSSSGIEIDLPRETETLSIISSDETDTGYTVQSSGVDKIGSIWHEKMLTGSEATADLVEELLKK